MEDFDKLGRIGYEAYGEAAMWRNYRKDVMPAWDALPDSIKNYWAAAAKAILGLPNSDIKAAS